LISKGFVTIDCLGLAIASQATLDTHQLHYLPGSGYPLMVLLGSFFIFIGKYIGITDPIISVNLISVTFSSIAVLAFYLLIKKCCDAFTAILASFILLLNPIFFDVSTYGINHTPSLCFLLLGLLSLLHFQTESNIRNLLLSGLYIGCMGATRLPDLILAAPAILYIFIFGSNTSLPKDNKHTTRDLFLFMMIVVLIITLLHLTYYLHDHTGYGIQAKSNRDLNLLDSFHGILSLAFINSLGWLKQSFNTIGIVCFAAGLYYTAVFNKNLLIFTVLWWIIPLGLLSNIITCSPRYFTFLLPAIIIPISIFLAHMLRQHRMLLKAFALISFIIIISKPVLDIKNILIRRHHYALISEYYRWVGRSTEPDATLISSDDGLFITYYSKRDVLGKPYSLIGSLSHQELVDFKKNLERILNNRKMVYITELALVQNDRYQEFKKFMQRYYHLVYVGQRPLELWYQTPYEPIWSVNLYKVEKKN